MKIFAAALLSALVPVAAMVATPVAAATAPKLTIESSLDDIAANPAGKASLTANFPGLLENPMYSSISMMTVKQLQPMAPDKMTDAQIAKLAADLAKIK